MAIYRGSGGSTSTTDQATIDQVAEDAATATTKAAEAASSASSAASSASSASTSATSAASSASTATTKASEASTSATNAATSASAASTSATSAASSATSASGSATTAASEAAAALSSKASALDAQTAAETAESNASDHADDAVKAAYGAEDVLQTLSDSSTLYSARHYASKTATDAATATTKAAEATSAASTASAASDAALAALDSFDDRYLGSKTSDPTLDNDGNSLVAGALYYNETDGVMKVYEGSIWVAAYASVSGALIAASNLSDLNDAASARTNLGVAIGTDVQAYSSVLANTTASYTTAEETKLAGIETAATADQTAQEIATAIDADATAEATLKSALGLGTAAYTASTAYATAAQGALADSAVQPADNVSTLTNDSGYITGVSVSGISDTTITTPADNEVLAYDTTSSKWINQTAAEAGLATAAQGALADSALQNITGQSIENLSDVNTMTPSDGQLLTWDNANSRWDAADAPVSLPDQTSNAGKYLTTNGTAASWGTISSDALTTEFQTTATGSVTEGDALTVNTNGDVGDFPILNTVNGSTSSSNSFISNTWQRRFSNSGQTMLEVKARATANASNFYVDFQGYAITGGSTTTAGTSLTHTISNSAYCQMLCEIALIEPVGTGNTFFVISWQNRWNCASGTYNKERFISYHLVTVDPSTGNVTSNQFSSKALSKVYDFSNTNGNHGVYNSYLKLVGSDTFYAAIETLNGSQVGHRITVSGTSFSTATDNEAATYGERYINISPLAKLKVTSSGTQVNLPSGVNNLYGSYSSGDLGTSSEQTSVILDSSSTSPADIQWESMGDYWVVLYPTADGTKLATYSVNATGQMTLVDSLLISPLLGNPQSYAPQIIARSSTKGAICVTKLDKLYFSTFEIDSSGNIVGLIAPTLIYADDLIPSLWFQDATDSNNDDYYVAQNNIAGGDNKIWDISANGYSTFNFAYAGIATTNAGSNSSVFSVIAGAAPHFTGLSIGSKYYVDETTFDGSITTTAGNFYVGTAISSTTLLVGI